jgi:hypothetical protein
MTPILNGVGDRSRVKTPTTEIDGSASSGTRPAVEPAARSEALNRAMNFSLALVALVFYRRSCSPCAGGEAHLRGPAFYTQTLGLDWRWSRTAPEQHNGRMTSAAESS